ncbi:MAG: hypothetical protein QY312_02970 [Candidatus Dojkabacteria bacterium]|nr:MAG: hypothetical protein QY312_02970 [Candidatus Dojkabacteria bacterium]
MTNSPGYTIHEERLVVLSQEDDLSREIASAVQVLLLGGKAWEEELGNALISVIPKDTASCRLLITTTVPAHTDMNDPPTIIARLHELIGENVLGVHGLRTTQDLENPLNFYTSGIIPVNFIKKSEK